MIARNFRSLHFALGAIFIASISSCSCGSSSEKNPGVKITNPTAGQVLTQADDSDAATPGIQHDVIVHVTNVTSNSTLTLTINGTTVGSLQPSATQDQGEDITFHSVPFPAGQDTVIATVKDSSTNKSGTDSKTVSVTPAATCNFTTPADGATLTSDEDASTEVFNQKVLVQCPASLAALTGTLQVTVVIGNHRQDVSPLTATLDSTGLATFDKAQLGEGTNAITFTAVDSTGTTVGSANETVIVNTGKCPVILGEHNHVIYNAAGGTPPDPTETRPVIADTDPNTPDVQATFTGYVDTGVCPGASATISFDSAPAGTATVDSSGEFIFSNVTLPNGDPVLEVVHATSGSKTGVSVANTYGVDSVIPVLSISAPASGTITDTDGGTNGVSEQVTVHLVSGFNGEEFASLADNGTPRIGQTAISPLPAIPGDWPFPNPVMLTTGPHSLVATATRKLGNQGNSQPVSVTVQQPGGIGLTLLQPGTTNVVCNHASDENPNTQDCDLTMKVQANGAADGGSVAFWFDDGGQTTVALDANLQAQTQFQLPQGQHTIAAVASNGQAASNQVTAAIRVDTIAPVLTWVTPPQDGGPNTESSQTFSVTLQTDAENGQVVMVTLDGGNVGSGPVDGGFATFNVAVPGEGIAQLLVANVQDDAGNPAVPAVVGVDVIVDGGCVINLNEPSTLVINASTDGGLTQTITGNTPTPACANGTVTFLAATPASGTPNQVGTAQAVGGAFSFTYTFTDQASTQFTAQMTSPSGNTNQASFNVNADTIPPVISLNVPQQDASGNLYVVEALGNLNVVAGALGYAADADGSTAGAQVNVLINVSGVGDVFGSGGMGSVNILEGSTPLITQPLTFTRNDFFQIASPTSVPVLTLTEAKSTTFTLVATDSVGNTTTVNIPLRVKSVPPPQPTLVTTDPGNGQYTHVSNYRHADFLVVASDTADPQGDTLEFDVGFSAPLRFGNGVFNDGVFDNTGYTTIINEGTFAASPVTVTNVPPLNDYSLAARAVDSLGNISLISNVADMDTRFPRTTIPYAGPSAAGALFGSTIALGHINTQPGHTALDIAAFATEPNREGSVQVIYGGSLTTTQQFNGPFTTSAYFGNPMTLGDVNNDGAADLLVYDSDRIDVYLSDGTTLPTTPSFTLTGTGATDAYTLAVVPDITGDGINDIVIGDPIDGAGGQIFVIRGRASWPASVDTSAADVIIDGVVPGSNFGNNLQHGTIGFPGFSGDTSNALVVPAASTNMVYLFKGSALMAKGQAATIADAMTTFTTTTVPSNSRYGHALLAYDINNDGLEDLLIADTGQPSHVFAYLQSGGTVVADPAASAYLGGSPTNFGYQMASGDLNGDGIADLVVGRGVTGNAQALNLFVGRAGGIPQGSGPDSAEYGDLQFGTDFAIGDVTGDGLPDIVVGEPDNGNGTVEVLH
ncbi:MAG: VCBS repeat-containing protein [Deltaproteobacteria bacterium]|nr:VCBS repeat-containing protein [Deltaproteobacteria bacterium]